MEEKSLSRVVVNYIALSVALLALALIRISDSALIDNDSVTSSPSLRLKPRPGRLVQEPLDQTSYRLNYVAPSRSPNQRSDATMLRTFEQAIGDSWKSTVQVMFQRKQLALGLIVNSDGWIITKASQLVESELTCRLSDGSLVPAVVKHRNHELDLALIKINRERLPSVVWHPENSIPIGGWLATTTTNKTPIGLGVVSVGPRAIPSARAVLGVSLGDSDQGALVSMVIPGGGAYQAGVEEGDVIVSIDGAFLKNKQALLDKIATLRAGQRVEVGLTRGENSIVVDAQLMDLASSLFDPTEMEVNGNISARATGFARAFQHDTVLSPHQCGGPVIDSRGRVVGLNIARAGRVNSYALPLDVVVPAVREMMMLSKSIPVAEEVKASR